MFFNKKITIDQLKPEEYEKCSNIWNIKNQPLAKKWLDEIVSGNRMVFVYKINGKFIGEGALVKHTDDSDYTIQDKRIYVSRMIVKKEYRNKGIGSELLSFLIKKAKSMVPLLVPLFISAFRRANDLAMAMEARCYQGGEGRTKMKPLIYKKRDIITYIVILLYFAACIVVGRILF